MDEPDGSNPPPARATTILPPTDAEQWEWTSRQEKIESDEGRARAAEYADTINRFLATLSQHPTPEPTTLLSDAGGHAGKDAPARDGAMSPLPEGR
jgi:hypothetical protein